MKRLFAFAFLLLTGCVHYDQAATFRISGTIVDVESGQPIESAVVQFRDLSLESRRLETPTILIATSDKKGDFDSYFGYSWGSEGVLMIPFGSVRDRFSIRIDHEKYEPKEFAFNLRTIQGEMTKNGYEYSLCMGVLSLASRKDSGQD